MRIGPLERVAEAIAERPVPGWDWRHHYSGPRERTVRYLLVLDTLNFSFWGGSAGGYIRLAGRLRDVFTASDDLYQPDRLAAVTAGDLRRLLGDFPMLEDRARVLRELGSTDFEGLVADTAAGTAAALAARLACYRDVAEYAGREVPLLKRAQIVPADLFGSGQAGFEDVATLTCFADYKLPQVLRHHGALHYSDDLAGRVDAWQELRAGEPDEVEIRAACVIAVERLREALARLGRDLLAIEVDWLLWHLAHETYPMRPHHRVRTVFY